MHDVPAFKAAFPAILFLAAGLAGCADAGPTSTGRDTTAGQAFDTVFRVQDDTNGRPIFLARIALFNGTASVLVIGTDHNGTAPVHVPEGTTSYEVSADAYLPSRGDIGRPAGLVVVRLKPIANASDVFGAASGLRFRAPVDMGSKSYAVAVGTSCLTEDLAGDRDGNCGLSEPSVEVDSKGTIYVTGTCCIGNAPPLYVSRDGGKTFRELTTPGVREAFGIEADLAIDGRGRIYMADIELAATFQVTSWSADGTFLRHMKWPAPPLVDRDWIRAEGDGKLYYVYNTGGSTNVYVSQDAGATWSPSPAYTAPFGLGNPVQGTKPGELWVLGGGQSGSRRADYTRDGGTTWRTEITTAPTGGGFPTGEFDEAGNLYVTGGRQDQIFVAWRDLNGQWYDPVRISPPGGHHRMPWLSAGAEGKAAVAWYGTLDESTNSRWNLFVAVSLDANRPDSHWQVAIADPEPILVGTLNRQLLDFLQSEIGPDGAIHVSYAKLRPTEPNNEEQLHYVRTEPMPELAPRTYFHGP